jgi:hypothetical protein
MITITVKLEFESHAYNEVLSLFLYLPEKLRPVYFCEDDKGKRIQDNLIENHDKFWAFVDENPQGFALRGMKGTNLEYSIDSSRTKTFASFNELKVSPELAQVFLEHMSGAKPLFAFAGLWDEYAYRNQAFIENDILAKINISSVSACIGRDLNKYIQGLYWLTPTLIPDTLLRRHNVPLQTLLDVALTYKILPGNLHLFKFYGTPQEWEIRKDKMDQLYDSLPGVFNMGKVKPSLMEFKTRDELDKNLSQWR